MSDGLVKRLGDVNINYDLARGVHSVIREARDRIEALEAERDRLRGALEALVKLNDDYSPFGGEVFQDRVYRTWARARAALNGGKE